MCLFAITVFSNTVIADMSKVRSYESEVESLEDKLRESSDDIRIAKSRIVNANDKREQANNKYLREKEAYTLLIAADDKSPGSISESVMTTQRAKRNDAVKALRDAEKVLAQRKAELDELEKVHRSIENDLGETISLYKKYADEEIEKRLIEEKKKYEKTQQVEVSTYYLCRDDETFGSCRNNSKAKAEREAIEKGAVVTVSSITQMKNMQIQSENIESEVNATIISRKVTKNNVPTNEGGFNYAMTALVQPHLSDSAIHKIRTAIAIDVMGRYYELLGERADSSPVRSTSSTSGTSYLAELEQKQKEIEAQRELVRLKEAQAAEEMERQRKAAEQAAAQREIYRKQQEEARIKNNAKAPMLVF